MQDEYLQKLLDRVKALHALAKSTHSPGEAENANRAAQQLITRYQLDQSLKFTTSDEYGDIILYSKHKARILWKEDLIISICNTNGCEVLIYGFENPRKDGISYKAFGKITNLEICKTLCELIIDQIDYLAKEDKSVKGKDGKDAFKMGCARRVRERLAEGFDNEVRLYLNEDSLTSDQKTALVHFKESELDKTKEFMAKKVKGIIKSLPTRSKLMDGNAYEKGKEAGNKVSLTSRKMLK